MSRSGRRASVDPKLLGRFLAGTPGRGLSLATADRIALSFGLQLVEGGRPAATKAESRGRKLGTRKAAT